MLSLTVMSGEGNGVSAAAAGSASCARGGAGSTASWPPPLGDVIEEEEEEGGEEGGEEGVSLRQAASFRTTCVRQGCQGAPHACETKCVGGCVHCGGIRSHTRGC